MLMELEMLHMLWRACLEEDPAARTENYPIGTRIEVEPTAEPRLSDHRLAVETWVA